MTAQEYFDQNAKGFEGDSFLEKEIREICIRHGIKTIIETGTYMGATTLKLAKMAPRVFTIEINPEYFQKAANNFKDTPNISYHFGNSAEVLPELLADENNGNVFLLLDAHWESHNPLLEELADIAHAKIKPCIAIHDFKVPDHPELGFDTYAGQDYEWGWIKDAINNIYGPEGYTYYYNSEAEGAKRGVIFIEPK